MELTATQLKILQEASASYEATIPFSNLWRDRAHAAILLVRAGLLRRAKTGYRLTLAGDAAERATRVPS